MRTVIIAFLAAILCESATAVDLEWTGLYRAEMNLIRNTRLSGGGDKDYFMHHLILKPKIVASDGFTIYGRFDIFNNPALAPNSQAGQVFGSGVGSSDPAYTNNPNSSTNADNSSILSQTQRAESLQVTQLYLNYYHEFGSLIVGRAPLHFGLGTTYNAGEGLFDHWLTTRDMVAYKLVFGNISVTPMLARVNQGSLAYNQQVNDYIVQAQYENPDTNIAMGVMVEMREANSRSNDAPAGRSPTGLPTDPVGTDQNGVLGGATSNTTRSEFKRQTINVFVLKESERFRFGVEGAFQSGKSGVIDSAGANVTFSGFGLAGETEYRPEDSPYRFGAKFGYVSGDDPSSSGKFEGYGFNRNYDVAFLMFNFPLGQRDFLRSYLYGGGPGPASATIDSEVLSNAFYFAPYTHYQLSDHHSLTGTFATGWLNEVPLVGGRSKKDLGYEFDLSFNYKQKGGIVWINTLGLLFPGGAFQGDGTNAFNTKMSYGFQTKAAVRF